MARGLLDYFPLALAEVAHVSYVGNEQHNPGEEMHWARDKSPDHADCIVRHLAERGTLDEDGLRHTAKVAWRALALLQLELESENDPVPLDAGATYQSRYSSLLYRIDGNTLYVKFPNGRSWAESTIPLQEFRNDALGYVKLEEGG
jgi:hypothetical protein